MLPFDAFTKTPAWIAIFVGLVFAMPSGVSAAAAEAGCVFKGPYLSCINSRRDYLETVVERFGSDETRKAIEGQRDARPVFTWKERERLRISLETNRRYAELLHRRDLRRVRRGRISKEEYRQTEDLYKAALTNYEEGLWLYHRGRWLDADIPAEPMPDLGS